MELATFLKLASQYNSFIQDDWVELLKRMGDIQYKTAIDFLEQSQVGKDKEGEIRSAITQLNAAYQTWYTSASDMSAIAKMKRVAPNLFGFKNISEHVKICRKACECALLIAMIYKSKNDVNLTRKWVDNAKACFELYHDSCTLESHLHFLYVVKPNPIAAGAYLGMALRGRETVGKTLKVERSDLQTLCDKLLR